MNKSLIVLVCVATFVSFIQSEEIMPRSWITSCKPCVDTMKECSQCIKGECDVCFNDIEHSSCLRCGADIKKVNLGAFYCDASFEYHQLACLLSCRWRDVVPFYQTGSCDNVTAKCMCA